MCTLLRPFYSPTDIFVPIVSVHHLSVDSASSCNRFQLKHTYRKFLPKTQSLDIVENIVDESADGGENCFFESINEELMQTTEPSSNDSSQSSVMPKLPLDNNSSQARPIFPNLSFSPYGSPRISRKPARESRRVSIDKNGSFLQLNQYKLMDQIGVVSLRSGLFRHKNDPQIF